MDKKSILAIALSFAVLYIYQAFFVKPPPPPKKPAATQEQAATVADKGTINVVASRAATSINAVPAGIVSLQQRQGIDDKNIPLETDEYSAVFSTRGAALKSFQLKKYRTSIDKNAKLIELVKTRADLPAPLTVSFGGSDFNIPDNALYEARGAANAAQNPDEGGQLIFTLEYPGLLKVEKIYRFHRGKYNFDLEVRTTNLTNNAVNQVTSLNWHELIDQNAKPDEYGHDGPVSMVAKNIEREDLKKMASSKTMGPDVSWGGFETKYFIAAMIPQTPSLTTLSLTKDAQNTVSVTLKSPKTLIPPGQTGSNSYSLYLGPKDHSLLSASNAGLENAIDFGDWLKWLAMPLLISLKFIYNNFIHNYGIAIILLTLIIKIIFWPLGNKSYRSMKEMQKLQPKIAEMREKYKDDKARISQEMMALYKSHKVNPLGGCLPMVIQIPVFFGLYKTLLFAIELRHSPLIWWIQDLSAKDPYYITPIIMGATMFVQQKMTPPAGDPMQAKIMLFMPIIFTVMFLNFPSGLVIYWLFNNIISIGQQYYINKQPA
ncbi:MAG: membrane protein insertase YidC [Deltaproteobacteria bacterium]|nr:membrane protein insertase YidC [Deltaproteobacteria bacterium]